MRNSSLKDRTRRPQHPDLPSAEKLSTKGMLRAAAEKLSIKQAAFAHRTCNLQSLLGARPSPCETQHALLRGEGGIEESVWN